MFHNMQRPSYPPKQQKPASNKINICFFTGRMNKIEFNFKLHTYVYTSIQVCVPSALPPNLRIFESEPERRCRRVNSPGHHTENYRL